MRRTRRRRAEWKGPTERFCDERDLELDASGEARVRNYAIAYTGPVQNKCRTPAIKPNWPAPAAGVVPPPPELKL